VLESHTSSADVRRKYKKSFNILINYIWDNQKEKTAELFEMKFVDGESDATIKRRTKITTSSSNRKIRRTISRIVRDCAKIEEANK
jgi:hypothetical protein